MDGPCSAGESRCGGCWVQTACGRALRLWAAGLLGDLPQVFLQQCQRSCITWCSVQLIQKTERAAWDIELFDCRNLWPVFALWHIKVPWLQLREPWGKKQGKQGVLFSLMVWGFLSYVVLLFGYDMVSNGMNSLAMSPAFSTIWAVAQT